MAKYSTVQPRLTSQLRGTVKTAKSKTDKCVCPVFPSKKGRRAETVVLRKGTMTKSSSMTNSGQICDWIGAQANRPQEELVALHLNNKNEIIAESVVARGTQTGVEATPSMVFQPALLSNAARLILVHNHPSGDPKPSQQDVEFTKRTAEAGKMLGIPVLDHLVVGQWEGNHQCASLRDLGLFRG